MKLNLATRESNVGKIPHDGRVLVASAVVCRVMTASDLRRWILESFLEALIFLGSA